MTKDRQPTATELKELIKWLAAAEKQYQQVQSWLERILGNWGCSDPENCAAITLDRVALRIEQVKVDYPNPLACIRGFARNVEEEHRRIVERLQPIDDGPDPPAPDPPDLEEREREDRCLERCLKKFKKKERSLLLRYHQFTGQAKIEEHKKLAAEWQITLEGLRTKIHRLCKKLGLCMESCLGKAGNPETI